MGHASWGRIAIIQGHPDHRAKHFCHALADAYAEGAGQSGYQVSRIEVAKLDFALLTRKRTGNRHPRPSQSAAPRRPSPKPSTSSSSSRSGGMPAFVYRWFFGAHSLRSLERNILRFCGIQPIRETLVGNVEGCGPIKRAAWLIKLAALGRDGV